MMARIEAMMSRQTPPALGGSVEIDHAGERAS